MRRATNPSLELRPEITLINRWASPRGLQLARAFALRAGISASTAHAIVQTTAGDHAAYLASKTRENRNGVDAILTAPYLPTLTPAALQEAQDLALAHGLTIERDDASTFWTPGETALMVWRPASSPPLVA